MRAIESYELACVPADQHPDNGAMTRSTSGVEHPFYRTNEGAFVSNRENRPLGAVARPPEKTPWEPIGVIGDMVVWKRGVYRAPCHVCGN